VVSDIRKASNNRQIPAGYYIQYAGHRLNERPKNILLQRDRLRRHHRNHGLLGQIGSFYRHDWLINLPLALVYYCSGACGTG